MFSCEICKNTFFKERLQWLLLRFSSCFQRSPGKKPIRLAPIRSSHRRCSVKKMFLEISQNSQENICVRDSFLIKSLWHRCFPVNFTKLHHFCPIHSRFSCKRYLLLRKSRNSYRRCSVKKGSRLY